MVASGIVSVRPVIGKPTPRGGAPEFGRGPEVSFSSKFRSCRRNIGADRVGRSTVTDREIVGSRLPRRPGPEVGTPRNDCFVGVLSFWIC